MKVGLIDYGRGNLRSVEKALVRAGAEVRLVESGDQIGELNWLVLPGVGSFGDAMANLHDRGLVEPIQIWLSEGRPFLGICLGFQLLFSESEESPGVDGLGWVPGKVVKFDPSVGKVPHMGWNQVQAGPAIADNGITDCFGDDSYYYHVHSYYADGLPEEWIACRTDYGQPFISGLKKDNAYAFQFHPEKSQDLGLKLLTRCLTTN
ncbi:MAG: imidazole glycerol phosphate synthase subunit HisH [Verrucomicrobiota bacterium]